MGRIGYARLSTLDPNADFQRAALKAAGCDRIFTDHGVSGTADSRPELDLLLDHLLKGDEVVVWKLDRLGRLMPGNGSVSRIDGPEVLPHGRS